METVGLDIGFGFTKVQSGDNKAIFKSILGEATQIHYQETLLGQSNGDDGLHLDVDGESFFVGQLAERQSNVRFFTLDQSQFVSRFTKYLALAALSRVVGDHIPVNLVTGLPIGHYHQYRKEIADVLRGEHNIAIIAGNGERSEKIINVNSVRVVPQPFGSMFNMMLNDSGDLADKRYMEEKIGVVDVGFRTADYTISEKMKYSQRGSRTTDSGIARAFSVIATKLRESSGVNIELYRLYDAVAKGSIKIRGQEYDISELTQHVFSQLAATVASEVDRLWTDDWDIDTMVITGGGGAVLEPFMRPLLNGNIAPLQPGTDARFNNVAGYLKYAHFLWTRGEVS